MHRRLKAWIVPRARGRLPVLSPPGRRFRASVPARYAPAVHVPIQRPAPQHVAALTSLWKSLLPALVVQEEFLKATCADALVVPPVSIRDGILHEMTSRPRASAEASFQRQVVASAMSLGRKYRIDREHAAYVTEGQQTRRGRVHR